MKRSCLIILFCLLASSVLKAEDWGIRWDQTKGAIGYKVYFKDESGKQYNKDVGNVTKIYLNDLNIATKVLYTYWVTAYNENCESGPSETIEFTRPEFGPGEDSLPEVTITIPDGVSSVRIVREERSKAESN